MESLLRTCDYSTVTCPGRQVKIPRLNSRTIRCECFSGRLRIVISSTSRSGQINTPAANVDQPEVGYIIVAPSTALPLLPLLLRACSAPNQPRCPRGSRFFAIGKIIVYGSGAVGSQDHCSSPTFFPARNGVLSSSTRIRNDACR